MNVPPVNVRHPRAGFTMLELLVVISILIVAVLLFATFLGPGATGPAIERSVRGIRAMVTNVRQNSSTRYASPSTSFPAASASPTTT